MELDVIFIDDEPKALKSLEWEINNFCEGVNIKGAFTNPEDAIRFLGNHDVDCVFLDIEMPQMDGFQFLNHFRQRNFEVVFITAYNQYAINAIKESALDYLLKPIDTDDLIETIEKLKLQKSSKDDLEKSLLSHNVRRIAIPLEGKLVFLTCEEILYCESDGNYTKIHLLKEKPLFVSKSLKDLMEILPSSHFYRVHNSYIVNLKSIREYLKTDGYVILKDQTKIPVSRSKKDALLEKF